MRRVVSFLSDYECDIRAYVHLRMSAITIGYLAIRIVIECVKTVSNVDSNKFNIRNERIDGSFLLC